MCLELPVRPDCRRHPATPGSAQGLPGLVCASEHVILFCAKLLPKLGARTFRLRNTRSDRTF
jgi:hypothetical protein